jgi:hypothetical protein
MISYDLMKQQMNYNDYKNAFPDKTQKEIDDMTDYLYHEEINNLQEI